MKITLDMLEELDACEEARDDFSKVFGYSAELTPENWEIAIEEGLAVRWCAALLDSEVYCEYTLEKNELEKRYDVDMDALRKRMNIEGESIGAGHLHAMVKLQETFRHARKARNALRQDETYQLLYSYLVRADKDTPILLSQQVTT